MIEYSAIKTKEPLTHATTWMNLKKYSEGNQAQMTAHCRVAFMKCSEKMSSSLGLGVGMGD